MLNKKIQKRVLFITQEYPAKNSPTALAAFAVIEKLKENYDVYCLALEGSNANADSKVFYSEKENQKSHKKSLDRILLRIRQLFMIPFYPVFHPLQQIKLNKKAFEICKQYGIDIVVCVSFPFEAVVAGNYIKKRIPGIKLVSYLIDAYACGTLPKYLPKAFAAYRKHNYERKYIKGSDLIIAMESSKFYYSKQKDRFYKNIQYLNPAFMLPPKEYNTNDSSIIQRGKINIVYAGYLYLPDRNPTYIIRLLSSLNNNNIRLIFIGKSDIGQIIENEKKSFNGEILKLDFLPHDQLPGILKGADALLHLGVSNDNAISGKIFEYMSYGKPIICTYFKEKEATLPYLAKYPLSCCINSTVSSFEDAKIQLNNFLQKSLGKEISYSDVYKLFYTSTPDAFSDVIKQKFGV